MYNRCKGSQWRAERVKYTLTSSVGDAAERLRVIDELTAKEPPDRMPNPGAVCDAAQQKDVRLRQEGTIVFESEHGTPALATGLHD